MFAILDQATQNHTNAAIKKRERGLTELATKFNNRRKEMIELRRTRGWPVGACIPPEIQKKKMFGLTVDDVVWNDAGLMDPAEFDGAPPLWMTNESVRAGIRAHLDVLCCQVDLKKLSTECATMCQYFGREHASLTKAVADAVGKSVSYDLFSKPHHNQSLICRHRSEASTSNPTGRF